MTSSKLDRLQEIKLEMLNLTDEARRLLRGTSEEEPAGVYWLAHIRCALDGEHEYPGRSTCTMQDTIDSLTQDQRGEVANG